MRGHLLPPTQTPVEVLPHGRIGVSLLPHLTTSLPPANELPPPPLHSQSNAIGPFSNGRCDQALPTTMAAPASAAVSAATLLATAAAAVALMLAV